MVSSVAPQVGAGSARRSTLPLGVNGSSDRVTRVAGSMYSGNCCRRCSRSCGHTWAGVAPAVVGTTYPTSRVSPAEVSAVTTAWDTAGWADIAASISPISIRNPRTFTWRSARPRNSRVPSGSRRARSPVR